MQLYIFDDVRITLYFGTFELRTEITLQYRHLILANMLLLGAVSFEYV